MPSKQLRTALEEEKTQTEHLLIEVQQNIAQLQEKNQIFLTQKIELELRLRKIEEELNRQVDSTKSVAFSSRSSNDKFSCQSLSHCTLCKQRLGGKDPKPTISKAHSCASLDYCNTCQNMFNHEHSGATIPGHISYVVNRQSLSSALTKPSSKSLLQSCQSIGSCSLCRKVYFKPTESCESFEVCDNCHGSDIETRKTSSGKLKKSASSCMSLENCSICRRAFTEQAMKPSMATRQQSEMTVCDDCRDSIVSDSESRRSSRNVSHPVILSCLSTARCSVCLKAFASRSKISSQASKQQSDVPTTCDDCQSSINSENESTGKRSSKDMTTEMSNACMSMAECSLCKKTFENLPGKNSEVSKRLSETTLCDDCKESILLEVESRRNSREPTLEIDPSCKSMVECSLCRKAFTLDLAQPSEMNTQKSETTLCEDCLKSDVSENESQVRKSSQEAAVTDSEICMSMANCSVCRKAFTESTVDSEVPKNNQSETTMCTDCKSSIISENNALEKISTHVETQEVTPSCKSIAQCSVCRKAFADPSTKSEMCDDCVASLKSEQVSQAATEKTNFKISDTCKSKTDCSLCEGGSDTCKSKDDCSLCKATFAHTLKSSEESIKQPEPTQELKSDVSENESLVEKSSKDATQQVSPSCMSLAKCDVCRRFYNAPSKIQSEQSGKFKHFHNLFSKFNFSIFFGYSKNADRPQKFTI